MTGAGGGGAGGGGGADRGHVAACRRGCTTITPRCPHELPGSKKKKWRYWDWPIQRVKRLLAGWELSFSAAAHHGRARLPRLRTHISFSGLARHGLGRHGWLSASPPPLPPLLG